MSDTNLSVDGDSVVRITAGSEPHRVENVAYFADGVLVGQTYYAGWPGGIGPEGHRLERGVRNTTTLHLDTTRMPAGVRPVSVSVQTIQTDASGTDQIVRLEAGQVPVRFTQPLPPLTPTPTLPPVFRDPQTQRPVFVRGMFGANAEELIARPTLGPAMKAAGVNCLFTGTGINAPRDVQATAVIPDAAFAASQDRHWLPIQQVLTADPLWLILGDGMDWTYNEDALRLMDFASDAALTAWLRRLVDTGRVIGIDLCDETAYRLTEAVRPRMARLTRLCRAAGLPAAYTTGPNLQAESPARWYEQQDLCDYLSYGLDTAANILFRPAGVGAGGAWPVGSVDQYAAAMDHIRRNPWVRTDCPRLQNVTLCGGPLIPPQVTLSQIGGAVATGAVGVKVYHLDTLAWKHQRQANPLDQIGADPETNPDRWAAMGHAFAAIAEHEARILQWAAPVQHTLGRWWLTRETAGPAGRFWLAVNRLEGPQQMPPLPAWATRVEAVTPTGRVSNPTTIPAGSWVIATD